MKDMPRKAVISKVSETHGLNKVEGERLVRTVLEGIAQELVRRGRFHIAEIGSITVSRRRPRRFFNPRTLEEAVSEGDHALKINISKRLRAAVEAVEPTDKAG